MSRNRFYIAVLSAALCIAVAGVGLRKFLTAIPSYHTLEDYTPSLTTRIYDMRGEVIAELFIEKRALLTLAQIPVDLQNAVIATEDSRFFRHWGISPRGMLRAALRNFLSGRVVQGGSTLTQQLAKLIFLNPERKIVRKIREILLSLQLERNFSKEEILQFYLNQIYFGHGAYGVQAAARIYFGKDVKEMTLAECALLAGMIKAPGGYSPFVHPAQALSRRKLVLQRMLEEGFIRREEMDMALQEPIPSQRPLLSGIQAPYFVEYVRRRIEPKYGYNTLWRGGLKIDTTLDIAMQRVVDEVMEKALGDFDVKALETWKKQLEQDQAAGIDPPTVSTTPPSQIQGAFVILDVKTGAIRALSGGRGDQFNRAVQARRQPGSTFKPFVWAAALNTDMTGATLVEDAPLAYYHDGRDWRRLEGTTDQYAIMLATMPFALFPGQPPWVPNNFDGKFMGVMTLRNALALSRNLVSVRLIEHIGPPQVAELAYRAGIKSHLDPVLSLGLGSSVVSPLELASAFGTFANGGIHVDPFSVARVRDARDKVLHQYLPKEQEALSPQLAYLITHLLKAVVESGTGHRARALRRPAAGKTGTTNDNKDLWFVGYTPDLVAAAWMGYDDFSSLGSKDLTGGSTVVPWWTEIMGRILKEYPPRDFPVPEDIIFLKTDTDTGFLALPTCPKQVLQAFRKGREPTEYCPFDHSRPLDLKASFSTSEGTSSVPTSPEPSPQDLPPLPTDQELESLYE